MSATTTKSDEVRARVEPVLKMGLADQAKAEFVDEPTLLRKAVWEYLIHRKNLLALAAHGRQLERC